MWTLFTLSEVKSFADAAALLLKRSAKDPSSPSRTDRPWERYSMITSGSTVSTALTSARWTVDRTEILLAIWWSGTTPIMREVATATRGILALGMVFFRSVTL